ncbi:hypothetical protein Acr_23g0006510 [Actinidia rufa]|uniref:Uncharacterized protein n=1 Tax=Actinidia rufa TaxID=165716 RepID=A0A7J0GN91_9ERIC|nr:hypothetical protein Acr_23g0006510 [Actinidia rufa]
MMENAKAYLKSNGDGIMDSRIKNLDCDKDTKVMVLDDNNKDFELRWPSIPFCVKYAAEASLEVDIVAYGDTVANNPSKFTKDTTLPVAIGQACELCKVYLAEVGDCCSMLGRSVFEFEKHYGKTVNGSLCVMKAMQQLWGIKTPDEDFGILLEAAVMYDRCAAALLNEEDSTGEEILSNEVFDGNEFLYPRLLFIIYRSGSTFLPYFNWVKAMIIGSADLGVCLHTSSSGLDLPMKDFLNTYNALNSLMNGALEMWSTSWATELEENAKPLVSEASALF